MTTKRTKKTTTPTEAPGTPTEVAKPWDRQPCDTEDSWEAFVAYRDSTPPRKLFARKGMQPMTALMDWYKDHDWKGRVAAFDKWVSGINLGEFEAALRETARERAGKHIGIINAAMELLEREINKYLDASRNSTMPGLMKPGDVTKMAEVMIKLDRVIKGEATENVKHTMDLSKLSMDDLKQMNELTLKALPEHGDDVATKH